MPEIRYSKRFEYLRVSWRVILPHLSVNILYMIVRGREERVRIMARVAMRIIVSWPFLWPLADSELNISLNILISII